MKQTCILGLFLLCFFSVGALAQTIDSMGVEKKIFYLQTSWAQYANGQTLTGTYRPAVITNPNVAPVTIQFTGAENAVMTLPGGRTTALTRFRFQ